MAWEWTDSDNAWAFDIETNGLLEEATTIHSLVLINLKSGEMLSCVSYAGAIEANRLNGPGPLEHGYHPVEYGLKVLEKADFVVAHNGLLYDCKVINKLHPSWKQPKVLDTLIMGKMIWPADILANLDAPRLIPQGWTGDIPKGKMPRGLFKRHSLEAWGYRLGEMKGEYAKDEGHDTKWLVWRQDMQDYCEQDVRVTVKFWELILSHLQGTGKTSKGFVWSEQSVETEHQMAELCDAQQKRGYGFDFEKAVSLAASLKNRQKQLEKELRIAFPDWWRPLSDKEHGERPAIDRSVVRNDFAEVTIKRFGKNGKELAPYVGPPKEHYSVDAPFVKIERATFNPKSRPDIGERLIAEYGWTPQEWGGKNNDQAKVDETTIKDIHESVLPADIKELLLEYLVVSKTIGMVVTGKNSWMGSFNEETKRIHGKVDPLGTVSHRGAHSSPNLGQVPAVSHDKQDNIIHGWKGGFGYECRTLFTPGVPGWSQTGSDASGLELRMLGHYLWEHDEGAFATRVSTPGLDIHAENAKITGLTREATKTVTYAFLYGAGPWKIGVGVGVEPQDIDRYALKAQRYVQFMQRTLGNKFVVPSKIDLAFIGKGQEVKAKFLSGIKGLKELKDSLTERAQRDGFIEAIDGRKLMIRKAHATLNQLLQGGGAVVCKLWLINFRRLMIEAGYTPNEHWAQLAWIHDEAQIEHIGGLDGAIANISEEAMRVTARGLDFRGELSTGTKHGGNWAECH